MGEEDYIALVSSIIQSGQIQEGRNGPTICQIGSTLRFDLSDGKLPILTTKRVAWKTCLRELLWFISGSTDNKVLNKQGVRIWDANASQEFLETRGLDYAKGDLGPIYGHQWRHYNAPYSGANVSYAGCGFDQLAALVSSLTDKHRRHSRRLILNAWNPQQNNEMALPPCHVLSQYHVIDEKLSCTMYQRSADVGLGLPFNIASYAFLTHLLAKHCGLSTGELIVFIGNAHIYQSHVEALSSQIKENIAEPPQLHIRRRAGSIGEYAVDDFEVRNYNHAPSLRMEMVA